jgi:hypothetical protein
MQAPGLEPQNTLILSKIFLDSEAIIYPVARLLESGSGVYHIKIG